MSDWCDLIINKEKHIQWVNARLRKTESHWYCTTGSGKPVTFHVEYEDETSKTISVKRFLYFIEHPEVEPIFASGVMPTCGDPACVNPAHMEYIPNVRRRNRGDRKSTCPLGHPLRITPKTRYCPICNSERNKKHRAALRKENFSNRLSMQRKFRFVVEGDLDPLVGYPSRGQYGAIYDVVSRLQIGATVIIAGLEEDELTTLQLRVLQMKRTKNTFKGKEFSTIRNRKQRLLHFIRKA